MRMKVESDMDGAQEDEIDTGTCGTHENDFESWEDWEAKNVHTHTQSAMARF